MEISVHDLKNAYIDKDGNIGVSNAFLKMMLIDPTSVAPVFYREKWTVYTPFDLHVMLRPGKCISLNMGLKLAVPQGFVVYFYTHYAFSEFLEIDDCIVGHGFDEEVVLNVRNIDNQDLLVTKYMPIAYFIVLPIINNV